MSLEDRRLKRAEAVRAALRRAGQPSLFQRGYGKPAAPGVNADFAYQEARQKLPFANIGLSLQWLKLQLTARGYRRYYKFCVTKPPRTRKSKNRLRPAKDIG